MNIHAQFSGEVAETIDEIIKRGRAASRTEAIRIAVLDYRSHHLQEEKKDEEELRRFTARANRDIWEDEKEDKVWAKYLKEDKK